MKRFWNVVVALALLILLAPILAIVAATIWLSLGRPVLLRQFRPGLHGIPFELLKFRTMSNDVDNNGVLLPDERRLSNLGKRLRQLSLDELPELLNVIKGDMSLVGPRPLLIQYLERYNPEQARRHEVKPGITGWAQVNGRNSLSWEEKFELDVWYVDHSSVRLDLKIMFVTIWKTLRRQGISEAGHATAREFLGSPPR